MKELVLLGIVVVVVGVAAALAFVVHHGPRNAWGLLRYDRRRKGSLRVGNVAPDALLTSLDGSTQVQLCGQFGARSVVLVFGSYT